MSLTREAEGDCAPGPVVVARRPTAGEVARRPTRASALRIVLRPGVSTYLVGVDVGALTVAAAVTGNLTVRLALFGVLVLQLNAVARLYTSRLTMSVLEDLPALVGRSFAAAAATASVGLLVDPRLATAAVFALAAIYPALALVARTGVYAVVRRLRRRHLVDHRTLVLGAGKVGGQLARLMTQHPEHGLVPIGFLDDDPLLPAPDLPVPVLGGISELGRVIAEFRVTHVLIAFGPVREARMVDVLRTCDRLSCEIFLVPRLFEVAAVSRDMDQLWGMPLVRLRRVAYRSLSWKLKRGLDVLVSALALLVTAPVFAACAVAVRLEGGPGVLFRQQRVGLDGRPFAMLKFRSLQPDDEDESDTRWSVAGDQRIGRVGRLLRATSLDELPQLWNVLRGDMSLVGPRPERPHFVAEFQRTHPRYMARHRVPSGLTGWAQVHGLRGDTSIDDRARFDNVYVENWSLWLDVKTLCRTLTSMVRRTGS